MRILRSYSRTLVAVLFEFRRFLGSPNVIKVLRHKDQDKPEQESDGKNNHRKHENKIDRGIQSMPPLTTCAYYIVVLSGVYNEMILCFLQDSAAGKVELQNLSIVPAFFR